MLDFAGTRAAEAAPGEWHAGLRPYQREDTELCWDSMAAGKSTALVHPTGCGKTRSACAVIDRYLRAFPGRRVLWLANRDFLCDEAARRIREVCRVDVSIEKADRHMSRTPVVVGSIQTLVRKDRRETIPRDTFGLVVYDEAHHAVSAGSMAILQWFDGDNVWHFGMTATLDRLDKVGAWNAWDVIGAERELDWAWDQGYLCVPVPVARPVDSVDISQIRTVAGDLNLGQLEEEIAKSAAPIAHLALEEMGDRPGLIYTPGVASAHAVAATMNQARPGRFVAVDAETPQDERRVILKRYDEGALDGIVNCGIYLEGLDVPRCACIVIARLTKSRSLYVQMAGRGSRPEGWIGQLATREERLAAIAASGKPNFKLVDVTGKAGRHNLCGAATLLGKKAPDGLLKALQANPGMDLVSAAKEARAAVEREQKQIAAMAAAARVSARRETFDLFGRYSLDAGEEGIEPTEVGEPATASDLEFLRHNALCKGRKGDGDPPSGITHADVLKLRRTAAAWRSHGLATFKQRRAINNCGLPTPFHLTFNKAHDVLNQLAANGWRPTVGMTAQLVPARAQQGVAD